MHSAEHILNRTMINMFGCDRSFSAHIEKKKSKCDYRFNRALTDDEIMRIQNNVNTVIRDNQKITEKIFSRKVAAEKFNLDKIPENIGDSIRVIFIGDYDVCPCIGAHVNSTREIGVFRIVSSSFNDSVLRIRFKLKRQDNDM